MKKQRGWPKGVRKPHRWIVQGEIPHQQFECWHKMRAQANFRGDVFLLSFEQFQLKWAGFWDRRGRGRDDYCLTREDTEGPWDWSNTVCVPRLVHLRRQAQFKKLRRW
jgi:hypothetical protein